MKSIYPDLCFKVSRPLSFEHVLNRVFWSCVQCILQFIQRFFAISSVFLSCSSCLLGCMCLQQMGLPPRQADGYVRVSAGYLQVMGTPQTRPAKPETSPRSKSHFTSTAFTCCPSNPVVHLFIPKLVPGQLLTMINKV